MGAARERRARRREREAFRAAAELERERALREEAESRVDRQRWEIRRLRHLLREAEGDLEHLRRRLTEEVAEKHTACDQRDDAQQQAALTRGEAERLRARVAEFEHQDRDAAKLRRRLAAAKHEIEEQKSYANALAKELRRERSGGF